jgi:hypothetical protein
VPLLGSSPGQYAVHLPVRRSSGGGGRAVPRQRGWWQPPARWSSNVSHSNQCHIARIVVLRNNQHKRKEVKWQHDSSPGGVSSTMVGVAATCNNQHKREKPKTCLSSRQEVVAQQINWQCQFCNGLGGSDKDNINANDSNNAETMTMTTTTMAAGSVRINTGTDAAAALHQGSMA